MSCCAHTHEWKWWGVGCERVRREENKFQLAGEPLKLYVVGLL